MCEFVRHEHSFLANLKVQIVSNGPDVPDALLQAHEEGRVVFFCGAGISYPAGLPGFKGLVEQIYQRIGTMLSESERTAFERGQFDTTLDLLERRYPGQRVAVRRVLPQVLVPKLRRKGATETQTALLRLASNRDGALRLVTTNFDRVFHAAAERKAQPFQTHAAPMLPIPKNSRWNGVVFLHGLLPEKLDDNALNRLVLTSGDFGSAYLTERWAASFVSELFRNYVVCFVGYSIDDPVLRYMLDALAADRLLGEITPLAWAFGACEPGEEQKKTLEWEAKGVKPVLYSVPAGGHDHSALHETLRSWADMYHAGLQGKEAIVVKYALKRPQQSTQQDDFVGRMLWALSDKSGLPAKRFADFNPAPALDWLLEAFSNERFGHGDLPRFGVAPQQEVDTELRFSLIRRPPPYLCAPPMRFVSGHLTGSRWDDAMFHLARWLVRHLDDPRLVIWVVERGGQLDQQLLGLIERELDRFASLQREGNIAELNNIRLQAPKAIPGPAMRTLWRVLLSARVKSPGLDLDLYRWKARLRREGLTATVRLELRELLSPMVALKKPFLWSDPDSSSERESSQIKHLIDWELELAASEVKATLGDWTDEHWKGVLPDLLEDFQHLLRDALDLLLELGDADEHNDRSYWDLPSITPHWQNRGFRDWVSLIELLRDAWMAVRTKDLARAARVAQSWFELPYPTFKRLALFTASQDNCISPEQWVDWLLLDDAWWLWSVVTKREVCRVLVLQGSHLADSAKNRLEIAILAGPPRQMYPNDLDEEWWKRSVAESVWFLLAKLNTSGLVLGTTASAHFAEISRAYPTWRLEPNERDEFSYWMSGTGDPDFEESRVIQIAPRKRKELVDWLTKPVEEQGPYNNDTWRDVCRERLFHSCAALCDLAKSGVWPTARWRQALQTWSESALISRSWGVAAPLVKSMPEGVLLEIVHSVTWWMKAAATSTRAHQSILLSLCEAVLALPIDEQTGVMRDGAPINHPVTEAINHPVGDVTQALFNLWFDRNPSDNELLPDELRSVFTALCNVQVGRFRHGRVLLGSRLIALFRVDRPWTERYLLPLFDWSNPVEAKGVWEGFLWSPRLYEPLLIALKSQLLNCANHYAELGEHRKQFAAFLTYAALGSSEGYNMEEFRTAIGALPPDGLEESAQALSQAVEAAAEQREDYWKNRAQPFWQQVWPKSRDLATPRIAESLARLAIATGGEFPSALSALKYWLKPTKHADKVVHRLHESGLCSRFPADGLLLLDSVICKEVWPPRELGQCLDTIVQTAPIFTQDRRYLTLWEFAQKRGL